MKRFLKNQNSLEQDLSIVLKSSENFKEKSSDFELLPSFKGKRIKFRPAAVMIPILIDNKEPKVILTKRTKNLREHAGQIAFPGGKVEKNDCSEIGTAIRESFEEIYLKPKNTNILGKLPKHYTITGYSISPCVAIIKNYEVLKRQSSEVAEIFKVPLKFLLDKNNMQIQHYKIDGNSCGYYTIPYGPYYIWGATARIIKTFSELIDEYE